MRKPKSNLLEDVQKSLTDPIYDICKNFSLKKSREYYDKWAKQWNQWDYHSNPADKPERISFAFGNLEWMIDASEQAKNLYNNMKAEDKDYIRWLDWWLYGQNVVVGWHRLKTFDEWLHDWLKEALEIHYKTPEDWARKIIQKVYDWYFQNSDIHLFAEWKVDEEVLQRMGKYEQPQEIKDRDIEKDIEDAKRALEDMEENNEEKDVTVLTFKM